MAYSTEVAVASLVIAVGIGVAVFVLRRIHLQAPFAYVALGVGMWLVLLDSGISPTLAGVAMGFLTPAVPFQRPRAVSQAAHRIADETVDDPTPPDADAGQWLELARLSRSAVSPLARLESVLHPWTSFVVVPLFALANAGITIDGGELGTAASFRTFVAVVLSRVLGKPLGIAVACLLAARLGLARLPVGIGGRHVIALGAAAGVPFSVSLLIAELSLPEPGLLDAAKLGIVVSALLAGVVGFVLLRRTRTGAPGA
jgi:NhaA family Na+:H+ antiporter